MKLSEAIRQGAQLRPQCFGNPFIIDSSSDDPVVCGSCALGAAFEALAITTRGGVGPTEYFGVTNEFLVRMTPTWPELTKIVDAKGNNTLAELIWHMNDGIESADRRYTREEIADIVEGWGY